MEAKSVTLGKEFQLQYVEQGDHSGVPVLLLHGFADSWRSFSTVLRHLPSSIHAFPLTQRGHGDSSRPEKGYSLNDFADDARAFMDLVGLDRGVLVGHSMGSAVATRLAIDDPERAAGLVLVGASSGLAASAAAREFWDSTLATLTDPVDPQLVRRMTEGMLVQPVPQPFLEAAVQEGTKVPRHFWREAFASRWNLEGDFSAQLALIQAPTLIMWGAQDARYTRADEEALTSAIAGARLVVYEQAGHMLHWEEPERFASDLVAFVGSLVDLDWTPRFEREETGCLEESPHPTRPPRGLPPSGSDLRPRSTVAVADDRTSLAPGGDRLRGSGLDPPSDFEEGGMPGPSTARRRQDPRTVLLEEKRRRDITPAVTRTRAGFLGRLIRGRLSSALAKTP